MSTRTLAPVAISVVLTLVVAGAVVATGGLYDSGGLVPAQASPPESNEWHRIDLEAFAVWLPPGWAYEERQGTDSFAGVFVGDGTELTFDVGEVAFTGSLPEPGTPGYDVLFEDIGGKPAKLVVAESGQAVLTGVHFAEIARDRYGCEDLVVSALSVVGRDLTADQQTTALAIYRSIHFPGVGEWIKLRGSSRADALVDIDMVSPYEGWAVGGDWSDLDQPARILHFRYGRWRSLPSPADGMLWGIDMVSTDEGWAVGESNVLHYEDGAWSRVDITPPGRLRDVQMVGPDDGWIGGEDTLLRYRDGQWQPVATPGEWGVYELNMFDAASGWALPRATEPDPPVEIADLYRFERGEWRTVPGPLPALSHPLAIEMSPDPMGTGWIGGTGKDWDSGWLARHCEDRFEYVTTTLPGPVYDVEMLDGSGAEGWAVGGDHAWEPALLMHFDDDEWTVLDSPTDGPLMSVSMVSRNEGWAVGGSGVVLRYAGPDTPPPPPGTATATPPATATPSPTATPTGRVSSIYLPAASKAPIELMGTGAGEFTSVAAADDKVYLGDGAYVAVIDVSDPASPWVTQRVGPLGDECTVTDLVASDGYVYANCLNDRAHESSQGNKTTVSVIATATDSQVASVAGAIELEQMARYFDASDGWVYVGGWWCASGSSRDCDERGGVVVIDARDPARLSNVGVVDAASRFACDLLIDDGYLFVAGGEDSQDPRSYKQQDAILSVLDLSKPGAPEVVARVDRELLGPGYGQFCGVVRHKGLLYVTPGPLVLDTSDPSRPEILTTVHFPDFRDPHRLQPGGDYIHALTLPDLSEQRFTYQVAAPLDPSTPAGAWVDATIVGEVTLPYMINRGPWENVLAASNGFAYVARGHKYGLYVIDVRDPTEPLLVGELSAPDAPARD